MKRLWFLLGITTMVGCAIASQPTLTYLPDGRQAYTIACTESTECLEQAGWVCGRQGYQLVAAKNYGSISILTQSVVIACKYD
jgi:hypothetical protein